MATMIKVLTILFLSALYAFAAEDALELGRTAAGNKDYNEALRQFSIAIKENPNNVKAYNNRGVAHYDLRDYDKAIEDLNKAIKIDPNFAMAYNNRGVAYLDLQDYDEALEDFNKAIELDSKFAMTYYNRGRTHRALAVLSYNPSYVYKALKDQNQAIKLDANHASAYSERSIIHATLGDLETAVKDARKACDLGDCRALQILKKENLIRD
jgi:tetratricopeptide (TPR) repeat protein